jgi:hypothetical protein
MLPCMGVETEPPRTALGSKLEQLEELLHQGHNWFDQREFFLLASARLDLEHPEPLKAEASK